jgi:hypothetical protein
MRVFISYGDPADQVTALRLQALGAVNGLKVYVPPAHTRRNVAEQVDPDVAAHLDGAQIVLGVIGWGLSSACQLELRAAAKSGKKMIVMADPALGLKLEAPLALNVVPIDPANPVESERQIMEKLTCMNAREDESKALFALGTITLGLLLLAHAD